PLWPSRRARAGRRGRSRSSTCSSRDTSRRGTRRRAWRRARALPGLDRPGEAEPWRCSWDLLDAGAGAGARMEHLRADGAEDQLLADGDDDGVGGLERAKRQRLDLRGVEPLRLVAEAADLAAGELAHELDVVAEPFDGEAVAREAGGLGAAQG